MTTTPIHFVTPPDADLHKDLLKGIPPGWKDGQPQTLRPGRLAQHFRRLPVQKIKTGIWELPMVGKSEWEWVTCCMWPYQNSTGQSARKQAPTLCGLRSSVGHQKQALGEPEGLAIHLGSPLRKILRKATGWTQAPVSI